MGSIFKLTTRVSRNTDTEQYNGDIIWDATDGPKHLKFWTGEKYERLSDMVKKEIKRQTKQGRLKL